MCTHLRTHCSNETAHTQKHKRGPLLVRVPLIKKNDASRNYLPERDGEKRRIWTKGGPLRLGGGADRQLMAAAPSVY